MQDIQQKNEQLEHLTFLVDEKDIEIETLRSQNNSLEKEVQHFRCTFNLKEDIITTLQSKVEALEKNVITGQSNVSMQELRDALMNVWEEVDELRASNESNFQQVQGLDKFVSNASHSVTMACQKVKEEADKEAMKIKEERIIWGKEIESLEEERKLKGSQILMFEDMIQKMEEKLKNMRQEMSEVVEQKDLEIETLKSEVCKMDAAREGTVMLPHILVSQLGWGEIIWTQTRTLIYFQSFP